jgi:hypothetical protein
MNCLISDLFLIFLSYLLTERVVESRLSDFLTEHNLLNSFQSAYTKLRSSETALLAVHDHIIRAIVANNKSLISVCMIFLLHMLENDRSSLLERILSRFGTSGTAPNGSNLALHLGLSNVQLG